NLRVFLASPGDVADERNLAITELDRLQYDGLAYGQLTVEPVAWDKPGAAVPMRAGMTPQEAIASGLPRPSQCDVVIVILWSRMGRALPADYRKLDGGPYASGTEWEYLDALDGWRHYRKPEVLVYRRTDKRHVSIDDPELDDKRRQWASVEAFFASF